MRIRTLGLATGVAVVTLVGTALAANGNCPNGLPFCFAANEPANASEVNHNFHQLKEWLESKVGAVSSAGITSGPITSSGFIQGNALSITNNGSFGAIVTDIARVDIGLNVPGNFFPRGYQTSCGEGTSDGAMYCCRIDVYTGETLCSVRGGSGWVSAASPFSSAVAGWWGLSCVAGMPSQHFPVCCRSNHHAGTTVCRQATNWALGGWNGYGNPVY